MEQQKTAEQRRQDAPRKRRELSYRRAIALVLLIALIAGSLGAMAFRIDNDRQVGELAFGSMVDDRIEVFATVEKIDAPRDVFTVRVTARPLGRFADDSGGAAEKVTVIVADHTESPLTLAKGSKSSTKTLNLEMTEGDLATYPLDKYATVLWLEAKGETTDVPVSLQVLSADQLFRLSGHQTSDSEGDITLNASRSPGTLVMTGLMFVVMWALAIVVMLGAWTVVTKRMGLLWPALGWMAATLFALAGFRQTAPGAPPIGCLIDYTAFLWAELCVASSIVVLVVRGLATDWAPKAPNHQP